MRPLHLEIEGLTSFRERVAIDFDGLDLFAITGPTGAGKSSVLDALVFALYGQVPRVGREYKQLISHGKERFSVRLDFAVGEERYRVSRTVRASGQPQVRLERLTGGEAESIAGKVTEIEREVEKIVGLDYAAFTRSVVLPQGEFGEFLKGDPKERRKILVSLLGLGVYEEMQRLANKRAAEARHQASFISNQLARDYAGVTPEALTAAREEQKRAEEDRGRAEAAASAAAEGVALAQAVRTGRRQVKDLDTDIETEAERAREAEEVLVGAEKDRRGLAERLTEATAALRASSFDEGRYATLLQARPRAEQLADVALRLTKAEKAAQDTSKAVKDGEIEARKAAEALPKVETEAKKARDGLTEVRRKRDEARTAHAAHALRKTLKPGQPCPVCDQVVRKAPKSAAVALDAADAEVERAEAQEERAREALEKARGRVDRAEREVRRSWEHLSEGKARVEEERKTRQRLISGIEAAGYTSTQCADASGLLRRIGSEIGELEESRKERVRIEHQKAELEKAKAKLEKDAAGAEAKRQVALERRERLTARRQKGALALEAALKKLEARTAREGWGELTGKRGQDEADQLERVRSDLEQTARTLSGTVARLASETKRLDQALARAAELAEEKHALAAAADLAGVLAQHLQANQFLAYVQEEALRVLAEDGSRHLQGLSQGRYTLACEAQEFAVVDHWNADTHRSVKTLSGGETFLASLSLALALAERVADLSSEGRAGETLESLFLDEGFGTLDAETLDVVLQALDVLHGGQRMVGVITHLRELAERLPARVEVARSAGTAVVTMA